MPAAKHDIEIEQGANFKMTLAWKPGGVPIDLTGYTARMQIREDYADATPQASVATGDGITLGGAAGTIDINISAAKTAAINATSGVYDLELVDANGDVTRLIKGKVKISPEVTK